jgi:predicted nucleic acid-binding protein
MIVLDSSILVSFFNQEDVNHETAVAKMKKWEAKGEEFYICDYVVLEVATIIRYKTDLKKANVFLDVIKNTNKINLHIFDRADFEMISKVFQKQKSQISFADAAVIYLALIKNSELGTFDESQIKEFRRQHKEIAL